MRTFLKILAVLAGLLAGSVVIGLSAGALFENEDAAVAVSLVGGLLWGMFLGTVTAPWIFE